MDIQKCSEPQHPRTVVRYRAEIFRHCCTDECLLCARIAASRYECSGTGQHRGEGSHPQSLVRLDRLCGRVEVLQSGRQKGLTSLFEIIGIEHLKNV